MKPLYRHLSGLCAVVLALCLCSGCTFTHATKMPQLQTGSPLQSVSPKVFALREFKDDRGTAPNFLYRLGASDHVLDQPVSKMMARVICKELESNGHKCADASHASKCDFFLEGTVIKYGIQSTKLAFEVRVIGISAVQLTITSSVDNRSVFAKTYEGIYQLSGFAVQPTDVLNEALPDMLRDLSTDSELVGFISQRFSPPLTVDKESPYSQAQEGGKSDSAALASSTDVTARSSKTDLLPQTSEHAFKELSNDLRKYEKLQEHAVGQDEKSAAWAELTKKYPQWTKDVSPGDTDAVRLRAVQAEQRTRDPVAAVQKHVADAKTKEVTLRNTPDQNFSDNDLYRMIKTRNFFSTSRNAAGHFPNDFTDNGDGTVTDRATGLMWQKEGSPSEVLFSGALEYVRALNARRFGGYTNWRLPTIEELCSLLEPGKNKRGLHVDEVFGGNVLACWSCDEMPVLSTTAAYVAYLGKGDVGVSHSRGGALGWHFVRAVRAAN